MHALLKPQKRIKARSLTLSRLSSRQPRQMPRKRTSRDKYTIGRSRRSGMKRSATSATMATFSAFALSESLS
jgi:hypothetical protein